MTDATLPAYLVTVGDDEYPVRIAEVTARQVAIVRMLHGKTPGDLVSLVKTGNADLPEVCALVHLSRLQAGDEGFDGGALLDTITLSTRVVIDKLPDGYGAAGLEDADPQP